MFVFCILKSVADVEAIEAVEEEGEWGEAEFEVAEPMFLAKTDTEIADVEHREYGLDGVVVYLHVCAYAH